METLKNITPYIMILIILWLGYLKCNEDSQVVDDETNKELFEKLDDLHYEITQLKDVNDNLTLQLDTLKNTKEEKIIKYESYYKTYFDTITNDSVECLPKQQVDSIKYVYEEIIEKQDTLLKVKTLTINKLTESDSTKTIIITNQKHIIKKEKPKKWKWGIGGFIGGFLLGKSV